ncbi:hypothetical protein AGR2A_Cc140112 [Agrobacterium genomosp. 2 str. CFBP 5494]|uniref:Uncharacterized protein n=1 Tax=Agrobacterium genomosp. 2 str. CFBP 5494 TaxID=1183436 RepID=A0A9W5AZQ5_9HYPH|nr:hypothetical protein AGR2A_Cc140112 [Agrobacterium genomosp. 2 str. CFBP 5494]
MSNGSQRDLRNAHQVLDAEGRTYYGRHRRKPRPQRGVSSERQQEQRPLLPRDASSLP